MSSSSLNDIEKPLTFIAEAQALGSDLGLRWVPWHLWAEVPSSIKCESLQNFPYRSLHKWLLNCKPSTNVCWMNDQVGIKWGNLGKASNTVHGTKCARCTMAISVTCSTTQSRCLSRPLPSVSLSLPCPKNFVDEWLKALTPKLDSLDLNPGSTSCVAWS